MSDLKEATQVEIWEAVTESIVFVSVRDTMNGGWKQKKVSTQGPKRIQITVEERRFNQDNIPEENLALDPFSNGQLICVQGDAKSPYHLTDDDLVTILTLDDEAEFESAIAETTSEVILRRMLNLAQTRASHVRYEFIRDLVDERYRVGGTQKTVQAMIDAGEALQGFVMR